MGSLTELSLDDLVPSLHSLEKAGLTPARFKRLRSDPIVLKRLQASLEQAFTPRSASEQLRSLWPIIYGAWLADKPIKVPQLSTEHEEYEMLVVVAAPIEEVVERQKGTFRVERIDGRSIMDDIKSVRSFESHGAYAVWCRNFQQADPDMRADAPGLETLAALPHNHSCMTLEERIAFGYYYWGLSDGGKSGMLDDNGATICWGSQDSMGRTPQVYYDREERRVVISLFNPRCATPRRNAAVRVVKSWDI